MMCAGCAGHTGLRSALPREYKGQSRRSGVRHNQTPSVYQEYLHHQRQVGPHQQTQGKEALQYQ